MEDMNNGNPYQRTAEWFQDRCGHLTASRCRDAFAVLKSGKPAASHFDMIATILTERLTGNADVSFTTAAMQWGIDKEPEAKAAYEVITGNMPTNVGFIQHPTVEWLGASPDGLVDSDGLVEIKCPTSKTHLAYLKASGIPEQYRLQMLCQMACTGRKWCDFVSYDPRFRDPELQLIVRRFTPAAEEIAAFEAQAQAFLDEVQEELNSIIGEKAGS